MQPVNLKKEGLKVLGGIGYVIALIWFIRYFRLSFWYIVLVLIATSFIMMLIPVLFKKHEFSLKTFFFSCLYIIIILNIIRYLDRFIGGVWAYIIGCAIICLLILWRRRKKYFEVKHRIETMIWGKPLYKYRISGKKPPKLF